MIAKIRIHLSRFLQDFRQHVKEWDDHYGKRNPRAPAVLRTALRTGSCIVTNCASHVSVKYKESEYLEWVLRADLYHSLIVAVPSGPGFACLNLTRPKGAPPFPDSGHKLMEFLAPHLRRAFQVHSQNQGLHDLSKAGTIALDMLDTGVIAVDEQGHILLANRQAEAVLDGGRGLDVHWGRLAATDPNEAIRLEQLISSAARAARGRDTPNDGLITLHGAAGSPPISAIVTPFRSDRIFAQGRPCALIFVYDSAAKMGCRGATLQKLFGLTPAECRLAGLLHSGLELRIAAQTLCVTPDTARFMLKKIFGKTRSHRQSELIQLMNRLPGEPQSLKHSQADE